MSRAQLCSIGFFLLTACVPEVEPPEVCALSCAGCCDVNGQCQPGHSELACGSAGRLCATCSAGLTCTIGACQPAPGDDAGAQRGARVTFPASVDFGAVQLGQSAQRQLQLTNEGDVDAQVELSFEQAPFAVDVSPLTVPARGSVTAGLRFAPAVPGLVEAVLTLRKSDGATLGLVSVKGAGGRAEASAPDLVAFGLVGAQSGASRTVSVQNVGVGVALVLGTNGAAPQYELRPQNANTRATDFVVDLLNPTPAAPGQAQPIRISVSAGATAGLKSAQLALFSNDPASPLVIALTAEVVDDSGCALSTAAASLDFGTVGEGRARTLWVGLDNSGTTACLVTSVTVEDQVDSTCNSITCPTGVTCRLGRCQPRPPFTVDPTGPLVISPQRTTSVPVRFWGPVINRYTPVVLGSTLKVAGSQARQVALTGTSLRDCLALEGQAFDLGMAATGCNSGPKTVTLYNSCPIQLTYRGASAGPKFSVTGPPVGTVIYPAGSGAAFTLRYTPTSASATPDEAALQVQVSQGGADFTYDAKLTGRATASATMVDTFVVPPRKTDLLMVIDDSCSMADKQTALSQAVPALLTAASRAQVDLHVGVVASTVDSGDLGRMAQPFFTSASPNLTQGLMAAVQLGTVGGATESCADAVVAALGGPGLLGRGYEGNNLGFLRDEAHLSVLCVTDADEQTVFSFGMQRTSLASLKGRTAPQRLTYNVIAPLATTAPAGCFYDAPSPNTPTGHLFFANAFGGLAEEICSTQWDSLMSRVAQRTFEEEARRFTLLRSPTGAPVVAVGGVTLAAPAYSVVSVDGATEVRLVNPATVGTTVTVSYPAACN